METQLLSFVLFVGVLYGAYLVYTNVKAGKSIFGGTRPTKPIFGKRK